MTGSLSSFKANWKRDLRVNSSVIVKEAEPTTPSINVGKESTHWHVMPLGAGWCSQQFPDLAATSSPMLEPVVWYVTAPRLDSAWFVDIPVVTRRPEVVYRDQLAVERFLGNTGKRVLARLLSLADNMSQELHWPLRYIEIKTVEDSEVRDWQYVLVVFAFASSFMTADSHLHDFYQRVDSSTDLLDEEEEDILRRMVFFDVGTIV